MDWKLVPENSGDWGAAVEARRKPIGGLRVCSCGCCLIHDVLKSAPQAPAGLYRQHECGKVERVEADVVAALQRAVTYVEMTYLDEAGEEAAEAKHDLDMCQAALIALGEREDDEPCHGPDDRTCSTCGLGGRSI